MNGFLNMIKAPGMSSGAVVAAVKRLTGEKVGHAGTLDPEASGVLPVMLGRGARLLDYFTDKSKSYVAEIAFTGATDTQDAQGTVTEKGLRIPQRSEIEAVLPEFTGTVMQCPPAYSAVKLDGVPAYARARRGETVKTKKRETVVERIALGEQTGSGFMLAIDCGAGTYIRTLCHDIGQRLGAPAHMRFLLRSRHGLFDIANGVTVEELQQAQQEGRLERLILPLDYPLQGLPRLDVQQEYAVQAGNGARLPAELMPELEEKQKTRVYLNGVFTAIYHRENETLKADIGLTGGK